MEFEAQKHAVPSGLELCENDRGQPLSPHTNDRSTQLISDQHGTGVKVSFVLVCRCCKSNCSSEKHDVTGRKRPKFGGMEVQKGARTGENRRVWAEAQGEYSPAAAFLQQISNRNTPDSSNSFYNYKTLLYKQSRSWKCILCLNESHTVQLFFFFKSIFGKSLGSLRALCCYHVLSG